MHIDARIDELFGTERTPSSKGERQIIAAEFGERRASLALSSRSARPVIGGAAAVLNKSVEISL
jgi:hypothetical protein